MTPNYIDKNMNEFEQFERAFSMHTSGPVADCECGRVFWDTYNTGYDWAEGEIDALQSDLNATGVPHGVERIWLEGHVYCMDCNCWHERAKRIEDWLRNHQSAISEWFQLEKKRLQRAAADVPVIAQSASA